MYDGRCGVDEGAVAVIGFVGAEGDPLELFEFTEEVFDEVSPFVHHIVDLAGLQALWPLGDDDLRTASVEVFDDPVAVEGLVGDQGVEIDTGDQRRDANGVVTVTGQEFEAEQIAERVGQSDDLCRPTALRLADRLALSPPFAPWA